MTSDVTKDYYDDEWEKILGAYNVDELSEKTKNEILEKFGEEDEELLQKYKEFYKGDHQHLTEIYYNLISDSLQNSLGLYYNGALIVDLDSDPKTFIDQDVKNIIKYSKIEDENKILECGCGSGYFFKRLIQEKSNIKYRGIDLSKNQISNAKLLNPDYSSRFKQCDWNEIEYADESFDNILFLETIGYAKDIDQLLSECHRVLKPGGVLFSKHPGCLKEEYHALTELDENIKSLSLEYGYEGTSLGMMMNVPYFIKKLEEHGFSVPDGAVVPPRDESLYIKSHFIEEVHSCFEYIKVGNSYTSIRYPDSDPKKFWERVFDINPNLQPQDILSGVGKLHTGLVEFFKRTTFVEKLSDDEYSAYRIGQKIMSPCVLVTAIKK